MLSFTCKDVNPMLLSSRMNPLLRKSLDKLSKRLRPVSTSPPSSLNASPLFLTNELYSFIVIPALLAACDISITLPPNVAPLFEAFCVALTNFSVAAAAAWNVPLKKGILPAALVTLLSKSEKPAKLAEIALLKSTATFAAKATPPANLATVPIAVPNALPILLEFDAAFELPFARASADFAAAAFAALPLAPGLLPLPPSCFSIACRVASEAAFSASTCPTPGMSIITAIIYFCPVNCAYK